MYSPSIAVQLRQRGHDVESVVERTDLRTASDEAVFAVGRRETRVIVTENIGDYQREARIAVEGGAAHPGLIYTTNARFPRGDARTVGRLVLALDDLLRGGIDLTDREYWLRQRGNSASPSCTTAAHAGSSPTTRVVWPRPERSSSSTMSPPRTCLTSPSLTCTSRSPLSAMKN